MSDSARKQLSLSHLRCQSQRLKDTSASCLLKMSVAIGLALQQSREEDGCCKHPGLSPSIPAALQKSMNVTLSPFHWIMSSQHLQPHWRPLNAARWLRCGTTSLLPSDMN